MKTSVTKSKIEGNFVQRLIKGCFSKYMVEGNAVERLNERWLDKRRNECFCNKEREEGLR